MEHTQSKGRILICDDERDIRDILGRLVRQEGYEALEAADGTAALAAIRQQPPDLLFLDVRMPGLDGIEVLRQVKLLAPQLAVVIISSSAATTDTAMARACGACGYLLKPFRHEEVLRSLQSAMTERQSQHNAGS